MASLDISRPTCCPSYQAFTLGCLCQSVGPVHAAVLDNDNNDDDDDEDDDDDDDDDDDGGL